MRVATGRRILLCGLLAIVAGMLSASPELPLVREGGDFVFGDERLSVRIGANGFLKQVCCAGRCVLSTDEKDAPFDLRDPKGSLWNRTAGQTRFEGVSRTGADSFRSRIVADSWRIDFHFRIYPDHCMLQRHVVLDRATDVESEYRGFKLEGGVFSCGRDGAYIMPHRFPPVRRRASRFETGHEEENRQSPAPLIADNGAGLSVLWAQDRTRPYGEESATAAAERENGAVRVVHKFSRSCGYVRPHAPQTLGDVWCWFRKDDVETMLRALPEWFRFVGQTVVSNRPSWVARTKLYCLHPGGTIESQNRDWGGFGFAAKQLERIAALGCTAVWLRPLEDAAPYHPRDYYRFQRGIGGPDDYRAFVAEAHRLDLRVLQDIVPHGGHNDNDRAKAHPEWIIRNRDGTTPDYWCFDFLSPTWIDYMARVADFHMREYGIDGFRIDAAKGSKSANWNRSIPYARASLSSEQGGFAMQRALRRAVKDVRPDGANLAEAKDATFSTTSDAVYDMDLTYLALPTFAVDPPETAVGHVRRWLHERHYAQVEGTVQLRHVESHDSRRSVPYYGVAAQNALFALTAWIPGMVMVNQELEDGRSAVYRDILTTRSAIAELDVGSADYLSVSAPAGIFSCLRQLNGRFSVVLINFNGKETSGTVRLPQPQAQATELFDAMSGAAYRPVNGSFSISMAPFSSCVLSDRRISRAKTPIREPISSGTKTEISAEVRSRKDCRLIPVPVLRTDRSDGSVAFEVKDCPDVRPDEAELVLSVSGATEWFAATAEGDLRSPFRVRHPNFDGTVGGQMYDAWGGSCLFDSLRTPFGFEAGRASAGAICGNRCISVCGLGCGRVRLLDRIGADHGLKIAVGMRTPSDGLSVIATTKAAQKAMRPPADMTGDRRLTPSVGGWTFEEGNLRVRFARNGAITEAWRRRDGAWKSFLRNAQVVSRRGYNDARAPKGYEQRYDLEPDIRFDRKDDGTIEARFEGRLRGPERLAKMKKPIRYRTCLRFNGDAGFDLDVECSLSALPTDGKADLAFRSEFADKELDFPDTTWVGDVSHPQEGPFRLSRRILTDHRTIITRPERPNPVR